MTEQSETPTAEVVNNVTLLTPEPFTEAIVVGDVIGPPGPSEWRAMREQAATVADTEFVPKDMRGSPEKVLAAMLTGRELGIGPMASLQGIRIQDGKPAYDAELMRALVRRRGHTLTVTEKTHFSCTVYGKRADTDEEATVTWDLTDAKIANLIDSVKDDGLPQARSKSGYPMPWEQYPKRMLFARATSELVADLFADVLVGGSYTPEELGAPADWDDPQTVEKERRGQAFRRIRVCIESGRVTREQAAEIGASLGVGTLADATADQAEAIASAVEATEPPDAPQEQAQTATGDAEDPTEPPDAPTDPEAAPERAKDVPLHDALRLAAEAEWTPSQADTEASGDAVTERTMLLGVIADTVQEKGWEPLDLRSAAGLPASRKKGGIVGLLAEMDLATLRAASDAIEAALVAAGEASS